LTVHEDIEGDQRRAEIFDALSHPTRIMILKALGEGALGFADLKKKTGIESSGHLQYHLTKLGPLVKTDDYGKYCLSDQGRDALLTVQTVENAAGSEGEKNRTIPRSKKTGNKAFVKTVAAALVILLLASIALNFYEFNQTRLIQNQVSQRDFTIDRLQDLSRIQIVESNPDIGMTESYPGLFFVGGNNTNMKPYRFWVDIFIQVRNPTPYNVTLQVREELNITLSGQESGNRVWNETRYFSVPMYSDDSYDFSLYRSNNYADQNAIKAIVNSYAVYVVSAHIPTES
jgi:DNA-binding transcriptional ArsR family regulator